MITKNTFKKSSIYARAKYIYIYDGKIFRKTKKEEYVWQGSAAHCGDNCDLVRIVDYLLVAIFRFFGISTQGNIQSNVEYNCKEIQELGIGYIQPATLVNRK
jgi:hypothetical protein